LTAPPLPLSIISVVEMSLPIPCFLRVGTRLALEFFFPARRFMFLVFPHLVFPFSPRFVSLTYFSRKTLWPVPFLPLVPLNQVHSFVNIPFIVFVAFPPLKVAASGSRDGVVSRAGVLFSLRFLWDHFDLPFLGLAWMSSVC